MSKHITAEFIADNARIVEAPAKPAHEVDRTFELPRGLYVATVGLYLGFIALMFAGFAAPGLIIPMAIFAVFIVAGFGVPALWTKLAPDNRSRALGWAQFARKGIMTNTGPLAARDAAIQMLILPVLILLWGLAVVTIAAIV